MVGFRPSVGLAYTGQYCATQAQRVSVARLLRGVIPGNVGAMVRAINGTTALLCDELDDITEDDVAPLPFTGGQCPGVIYRVVGTRETTNCNTGVVTTDTGFVFAQGPGPISRETTSISEDTTTVRFRYGNGNTSPPYSSIDDCPNNEPGQSTRILGAASERVDGLPDECGDPPREFPEPLQPLPLPPIDFTFENNEGVTVNATANITLAPAISIGGNVSFPVDIEIGDLTFNGNFNLDGSFEFSPTVNINPPGSPPTIGPSLPGDSPAVPDESQSVLAGVAITVQSFGPAVTLINAIGAPNLVVPRAASVNFLIDVEGDQFWSSDFDAKNGDCFVPCPPDVVCVDAAVTPYPGVDLTWQRVYREERIPAGQ